MVKAFIQGSSVDYFILAKEADCPLEFIFTAVIFYTCCFLQLEAAGSSEVSPLAQVFRLIFFCGVKSLTRL